MEELPSISKANFIRASYGGEEVIWSLYKRMKNIHFELLLHLLIKLQVGEVCSLFNMCMCFLINFK